jgi:periplasmic protein TonB
MNFSFGSSRQTPSSRTQHSSSGASQFSFGPVRKGAENDSPFADIENDNGGPDWRNLLSRWVQQHAYYPPEARANLEEGYAKVHVEAGVDGRVHDVELIGRSGSVWLDMALLSLFRDQRIPQVPGGTTPIVFNFTMHYILIRR